MYQPTKFRQHRQSVAELYVSNVGAVRHIIGIRHKWISTMTQPPQIYVAFTYKSAKSNKPRPSYCRYIDF